MDKKVKKFKDGLQISYYEFSKDIVCVEVNQHGKNMGQFCSDVSYFEEWDENDLLQLTETHIKQVKNSGNSKNKNRKKIDQYEIEYYSYFDGMFCVDVYKDDNQVCAFCSDKHSFEEWMEEEAALLSVIQGQIR
ncbi:hypothetical protein H1D32_13630 [Anaerobacillus sp. CMMVII]|uniref:hypothetical protein n=1 Tax=Anaerobacillus sp. CMMVII TaxID=2755588 RepID=UPI0021B821BA|nr:hypothetical protein [Anaerobacillus sp. CMMVII]MCT8138688.1 hypothetical protein [Anaerobacillus sp. CMMVII]